MLAPHVAGRFAQFAFCDTGRSSQVGQAETGQALLESSQARGPGSHEFFVLEPFVENRLHQAGNKRRLGARPVLQVGIGVLLQLDVAQMGEHQLGVVLGGSLDDPVFHAGRLGVQVAAEHQDRFGLVDLVDGGAGAGKAEGGLENGLGLGVAEPGLGVDVAGADGAAQELLEEVALFVGDPRRSDPGNGGGAVAGDDLLEPLGGKGHRLVPVGLGPVHQRYGEPPGGVQVAIAETAVDAEIAVVVGGVVAGDPLHAVIAGVVLDLAAGGAEAADAPGDREGPGPAAELERLADAGCRSDRRRRSCRRIRSRAACRRRCR